MPLLRPRFTLGALTGSTFSSLAIDDYRYVFFGNMAFQFSIWMQQLVFGWLLLVIGNSPFWLGLGGFCYGVTMIVMGPIGGALADAWERRRAMLLTQTTAVGVNAVVVVLLWLGWLQIWHLLLASVAMGCAFTINMPARQSLMAELVPRPLLHNAISLHTASMNFNRITGPAVAGALMAAIGPLAVLIINLVANSWTVRQLTQVRYRPTRAPKPFRPRADELLEGFRYCWRDRALFRVLMTVGIANFFGFSYVQLLPSLARDSLRVGPGGLGLLTSAMGGGALIGALVLARRGAVARKSLLLSLAATGLGLLLVGLGRADGLVAAVSVLALIGAVSSVTTALGIASVQAQVPDELSGRVFGIYMLTMGLMPLGSLPAGALAAQIGTGPAIATWGVLCALASGGLLGAQLLGARRLRSEAAVSS